MTKKTYILIPPSEGKRPGGAGEPIDPTPEARVMIERLSEFGGDWGKLLGVKGKALDEAIQANHAILHSPSLPAIERYSGVVYDGIDYPGMAPAARRVFNTRVRIVSAVFGLLKPADPIPDYKLSIAKLDAAHYWREIIADRLRGVFVIDLLPLTHLKAAPYDGGIRVDFIRIINGKRTPAGHQGKFIKGRFIRWLCENKIADPADFSAFHEDGYRWTGDSFVRKG
ncbi:MAG: peroxide stress protein YaaA [bacterium]|nr:peroxide stress protein YaaA [bacterium]